MVKTESTEIFKTLDIYQKCQKYTGIFGFSTVSVKNVENIPEFQAFWRYLSTQKQHNGLNSTKNESKNGQKSQKLDQNFRLHTKKWPTFDLLTFVENVTVCTGMNVPVFPVHIPKNVPNSKTLTGTHGLTCKPYSR